MKSKETTQAVDYVVYVTHGSSVIFSTSVGERVQEISGSTSRQPSVYIILGDDYVGIEHCISVPKKYLGNMERYTGIPENLYTCRYTNIFESDKDVLVNCIYITTEVLKNLKDKYSKVAKVKGISFLSCVLEHITCTERIDEILNNRKYNHPNLAGYMVRVGMSNRGECLNFLCKDSLVDELNNRTRISKARLLAIGLGGLVLILFVSLTIFKSITDSKLAESRQMLEQYRRQEKYTVSSQSSRDTMKELYRLGNGVVKYVGYTSPEKIVFLHIECEKREQFKEFIGKLNKTEKYNRVEWSKILNSLTDKSREGNLSLDLTLGIK